MVIALRSGGRTFQALDPATTNALSAVRVHGLLSAIVNRYKRCTVPLGMPGQNRT